MARIIVGMRAFDSGAHGEQRSRALKRLYLTLLIHAEHQSALRRSQIQTDDIASFPSTGSRLNLKRSTRCGCARTSARCDGPWPAKA